MIWLFNLVYLCLFAAYSPWLAYRYFFQNKSRLGWGQKLLGLVPELEPTSEPRVWIHAVSVGEVNLLTPLIRKLKERQPNIQIAISTSTETGFDLANRIHGAHPVFFCPLDFSWAIRNTIRRIRPDVLLLSELELWPNLISVSHSLGVKVAIANARLSESSFRGYQRVGFLLKPVLAKVSFVGTQTDAYAQRFRQLGCQPDRVVVTGSVKFDNAVFDRENAQTLRLTKLLSRNRKFVFVGGSTQFEEDLLLLTAYQQLSCKYPGIQLVLVPRHPERTERLCQELMSRKLDFVRRSQPTPEPTEPAGSRCPVMIVDVIGELGAWWGVADAGYVGGSMGTRGGQNMIEPAAYGIPVSFGPRTENFREVVRQLLGHDAAVVVRNQDELVRFMERGIDDVAWSEAIGAKARDLVISQQGATDLTATELLRRLELGAENKRQAA